jgi:methionine synthase II (cobalamin-independent)
MPELRENREIDGPALEAVEVAEIAKLVRRQESIGLHSVTDDE